MMELDFRLLAVEDAEMVSEHIFLVNLATPELAHPDQILWLDTHYTPKKMELAIQESFLAVGAYIGEELVSPLFIRHESKDEGHFFGVYVSPQFQHRGFGTKIMNYGLTQAKQLGYKIGTSSVFSPNIPSQALMIKTGFRLAETIPSDGFVGWDLLEYEQEL